MSFRDPPELPEFIAQHLPFERRVFEPTSGDFLHFVDHGSHTGQVVYFQHGNPTWSFLWRKVMARLDPDRFRCIAPDMLGLGWSRKLPRPNDHFLQRHLDALCALVDALGIRKVILVGQDWGGPLITGIGAAFPDRIAGVVLGNTSVLTPKRPRGTKFHRFSHSPLLSDFVFRVMGFPLGALGRAQGDPASISRDVARSYRWPLRRFGDRAAPLGLARMVANSPEHPSIPPLRRGEAWIREFTGPLHLVWGLEDPILGERILRRHQDVWPDAPTTETQAGHFLQEEVPDELAAAIEAVAETV